MICLDQLSIPIIQAPMAGGPSTPELAAAVTEAGGLGFLAAGYLTADQVREQIEAVRSRTARPFGVNIFLPEAEPTDPRQLRAYAEALEPLRRKYGVAAASSLPEYSDDDYAAKLDLLLENPVPVVSFTFGLPEVGVIRGLQRQGSFVILNATSDDELEAAQTLEPDALVVQSAEAGGHRASHTQRALPDHRLLIDMLRSARQLTTLPVIAAGGVSTADEVRRLIDAGAAAVQVGTAFAVAEEAGTNPVHRRALLEVGSGARSAETVVTRVFSGRAARALSNAWTRELAAEQIPGYPQVHYLTAPLRAAGKTADDPDGVNLWAGTGAGSILPGRAEQILRRLDPVAHDTVR